MNRDPGTYEAKFNSSNTHVIGVADEERKGGANNKYLKKYGET